MSSPLLVASDIYKHYGEVRANDGVSLSVNEGELHALIGENGAGKSTLINILYGITRADKGEISWRGQPITIKSPSYARSLGIGVVFQKFSLFNPLTVMDNIALAIAKPRDKLLAELNQLCERYGLQVDATRRVDTLSAGEKQRIEIIRCLLQEQTLLIMDEPTSVLTPVEVEQLFVLLRALSNDGCTIIFISHKLNEVESLCQRVTVLRRGKTVVATDLAATKRDDLVHFMVGDTVENESHLVRQSIDEKTQVPLLQLQKLHCDDNVSPLNIECLNIKQYHITGIAGIAGNGQEQLLQCINGERCSQQASVVFDGKCIGSWDVEKRLRAGILSVPTDRYHTASVGGLTLIENTLLGCMHNEQYAPRGILCRHKMTEFAEAIIADFNVATPSSQNVAGALSGGNLQKFIIGRAIKQGPRVLVIANPTWGVDVQSALFIREQLRYLAQTGVAILVISEDLDELFEIADDIAVINNGTISPSMPVTDSLSAIDIGALMAVG